MEGNSLQAEVMQKVPEFVVHERMSQGKKVKCTKEKKVVKGWSTEEMQDKPSSIVEEDTETCELGGDGSMPEEVGGKN